MITLSAANPPIGILNHIEFEPIEMQLEPGDLIILMTDGVYDTPDHAVNKDAFMARMISEIDTKDPQGFADCLLEKVVRHHGGRIMDDMTIVVSKVEKHLPRMVDDPFARRQKARPAGTRELKRTKTML